MGPLAATILSVLFLIAGGISLGIMMAKFGGTQFANPDRMARLHRILGWISVLLYLVLLVAMVKRIEQYWEVSPARIAIHVTLAVALFFLFAVKVSIPRYFPGLAKHLFLFGAGAYLTGFVLVGITAGFYLLQTARGVPYISHADLPASTRDPRLGLELVIAKCSTCHLLRDILAPRTPREWEEIVNRMVVRAIPRIRPGEASLILHYLTTGYAPRKSVSGAGASPVDR